MSLEPLAQTTKLQAQGDVLGQAPQVMFHLGCNRRALVVGEATHQGQRTRQQRLRIAGVNGAWLYVGWGWGRGLRVGHG